MNNVEQRRNLWKEKRVFYLTPQVMVNDLKSNICPAELIKCVVFDEAHKAIKDYAYCQVAKLLLASSYYRTLALSATPGSDIHSVQQVIQNLNINALEIRGEDALDVAPYTHTKSIEKIVVELSSNILRVKEDFLLIYDKYARRLKDYKALSNNISFLTKFQVLKACEKFRSNPPRGINATVLGSLICDFTVCISLAHSLELLQVYGLRAFHSYLTNEGGEKNKAATNRLRNDEDLQKMLTHLGEILYPKPENHAPYTWGHPKLQKLVATVTEHFNHFKEKNESTKAIVFCQYRVVVSEIVEILQKCSNIKPAIFVGQSGGKEKGMPQIKQLQIMKDFREGKINCLVATCVAEEGLDIGEVDLILLMETHKSPVRLVQRLGRTGRKRKGKCVILLTNGKELEKFHAAMAARKNYVNTILNSSVIKSSLSKASPLMIPHDITPQQQLVHINVVSLVTPVKQIKSKQIDIRNCFQPESSPYLSVDQFKEMKSTYSNLNLNIERLPKSIEIWPKLEICKKMSIEELLNGNVSKLSYWNDWNLEKQQTYFVSHTKETELLCHLLHLSRNSRELNTIYCDMEKEELNGEIDELKEKECKDNDKMNEKEILKVNECLVGRTLKKSGKVNTKNAGKMLDIRSCMSLAATKVKCKKMTNEVIEILDDDELPQIHNELKKSVFLDDILGLIELSSEQIKEIYSEKYLIECPFVKIDKLYSTLDNYMIPKNVNIDYYSIVPKVELPDLDELTENLFKFLNENDMKLENSFITSNDVSNLPKKREQSSADSNDIVNLDDLFSNESNFEVKFIDMENNGSIQNFDIKDSSSKKASPDNILLNVNVNNVNMIHKDNIPPEVKKTTPGKKNLEKTERCSESIIQELNKQRDFHVSTFVCSTPLQLKKPVCEKEKYCLHTLSEEAIEEEDDIWNLSDLFDESDEETKIDNKTMKIGNNSKMESCKEISNQRLEVPLNKSSSFNESMKQISKEMAPTPSDLNEICNISNCGVEINKNVEGSVHNEYRMPSFSGSNNLDDSTLSDFTFNSYKRQPTSKPNFKIFKRKKNLDGSNTIGDKLISRELSQKSSRNMNEIVDSHKVDIFSTSNCSNLPSPVQVNKTQNSSIKLNNCKSPNKSCLKRKHIVESDEDDVFEILSSVKKKNQNSNFQTRKKNASSKKMFTKKHKVKKEVGFIEKEADVSGLISTDDSDDSSLDDLDESFINDENHSVNETYAVYLRSIKSPRAGGKFKIPVVDEIPNNIDVFSQQIEQDSTYINDSFCVNSSAESESSDISQLEVAELLLEEKRRRNREWKRKSDNNPITITNKKKRRIIESPESAIGQESKVNNSSSEGPGFENNCIYRKNKRLRVIQSESEGES